MQADVDALEKKLAFLLRFHAKAAHPPKTRITVNSVPLMTEAAFDGVPLRRVLSPETPASPASAEQLIDLYLHPLIHGEGTPLKELETEGGVAIAAFVGRGCMLKEQVVRLLYALGNHPDATLEYGNNRMMVTHGGKVFGFENGEIVSRFSTGFKVGSIDPRPLLERSFSTFIYDKPFGSLYREAYRRGVERALVALHTGQPQFSFRAMAKMATPEVFPSATKLRAWEQIITTSRDPAAALYTKLVPTWMTRSTYTKAFGSLTTRRAYPTEESRQLLLNKLYLYFNNKKNKETPK